MVGSITVEGQSLVLLSAQAVAKGPNPSLQPTDKI